MNIAELTKAMKIFNRQIRAILKDSGFIDNNELYPDEFDTNLKLDSDGYEVPDLTPDEWQLVRDYGQILDKLYTISDHLLYLSKPITYTGTLRMHSNGRYACGHYDFPCGSFIEYEKYDDFYGCFYWTTGRVEFDECNGGYYIYGDSKTQLDGLHVRFRW